MRGLGKRRDVGSFIFAFLTTVAAIATPLPLSSPVARAPAVAAFASAWARIDRYRATLEMHEISGEDVQDRTYAYEFARPTTATIAIVRGPGHGGKVFWTGGESIVGEPPGILSAIRIHLSIHDRRATTLRGDTVAMASFGWLLDHLRRTAATARESAGESVDGVATTDVSLDIAHPSDDDGLTREIVTFSNATKLPVEVRRYVGARIVKSIIYRDVTILKE